MEDKSYNEKILIENIKEYYKNAVEIEEKRNYNSAVTLYFKTLAILSDLLILRGEKRIPRNHSERFRILESKYPEVYKIIDRNFSFYQNSYRIKLNKEVCELFRKDAEQLIKLLKI